MARRALEHVRRMRGGAQAHLLRCEDDHYYVTKCCRALARLDSLATQ